MTFLGAHTHTHTHTHFLVYSFELAFIFLIQSIELSRVDMSFDL